MTVTSQSITRFIWDYSSGREKLRALYEKGKTAQWNAITDIDWTAPIEFGGPLPGAVRNSTDLMRLRPDCPVPDGLWHQFRWEYHAWLTSQFLHGEQGALLATARLVEAAPDLDSKFYAASQVGDEARHVEAYAMYMGRLGHAYPVNSALKEMLATIVSESRWDVISLGMQIIVEGLALASFRLGNTGAFDPVIRQITELVARDEARHVAYGVLSLQGLYDDLTSAELADREEFIKEAALLMSRRLLLGEVWERMGLDVEAGVAFARHEPLMVQSRRLMFDRIVGNLTKLGLFTPSVRAHFEDLSLLRARP
jgi:hypothetical protein